MEYLTREDVYEAYFKSKYPSKENMTSAFLNCAKFDKERKYQNIKYLLPHKRGFYLHDDIKQYFKHKEIEERTIRAGQQAIIEFEIVMERLLGVKGVKTKVSKILNTSMSQLSRLNISSKKAKDIIARIFVFLFFYVPSSFRDIFTKELQDLHR